MEKIVIKETGRGGDGQMDYTIISGHALAHHLTDRIPLCGKHVEEVQALAEAHGWEFEIIKP